MLTFFSGTRVMGIVANGAMSNLVTADKDLTWPVPENWSLEEGATVPVVYATALYALVSFYFTIVNQYIFAFI